MAASEPARARTQGSRALSLSRARVAVSSFGFYLLCARALSLSFSLARVADAPFGFFVFAVSVPALALPSLSRRESKMRILVPSSTVDILVPEAQS